MNTKYLFSCLKKIWQKFETKAWIIVFIYLGRFVILIYLLSQNTIFALAVGE